MEMFVSGLIMFFTLHFITATPVLRQKFVQSVGPNLWKGLVALGSLGGVVLICLGWKAVPATPLFAPSVLAIRLAPVLVSIALILFVIGGGNLRGHIKRNLHHPMLVGAILWSGTHLLANGGIRESILFGSFLIFSIYALWSLLRAGKRANFEPALKWDLIGIGIGMFVAIGFMHGHAGLFGKPVVFMG